jgi:hypothetical protein
MKKHTEVLLLITLDVSLVVYLIGGRSLFAALFAAVLTGSFGRLVQLWVRE